MKGAVNKNESSDYVVGFDKSSDGSNQTICVFNKPQKKMVYTTTKLWKVKLGLRIAKFFGWTILKEEN